MSTSLAHITIVPGGEARFEELTRQLFTATHATEPGCLRYEYWRAQEPGRYYTLLSFDDFEAFLAHQTSDHHEEATSELRTLIESIRVEWLDPVQGASDLPPSLAADAPADADETTARYARMFAVDVADWWLPLR